MTRAGSSSVAAASSSGRRNRVEVEHALHVDVQHPVPRRVVVVGERRAPRGAGVVDQDVQPVLTGRDLVGEAPALGLGREVGRDPDALALLGQARRDLGADVGLPRRHVDLHAGADVGLGHHQADAAGAAGDHRGLAADGEQLVEYVVGHRSSLLGSRGNVAPDRSPRRSTTVPGMRAGLAELLATKGVLLADGATGTNYFAHGARRPARRPSCGTSTIPNGCRTCTAGSWRRAPTSSSPTRSGATVTGWRCTAPRPGCGELARRAAELAGEVAEAADRPVVVAGSVGPTGSLFEPLGDAHRGRRARDVPRGDRGARRRRRRRRVDRDDVGAGGGPRRRGRRHRGRRPVRGDVLVRHRRPHDDGPAARATDRRVRRAAGRRRSRPARTAASARPTSSSRCWR